MQCRGRRQLSIVGFLWTDRRMRRGGRGVDVERGPLGRPWWGAATGKQDAGRPKGPHPSSTPLPPLQVRSRFRGGVTQYLPLKGRRQSLQRSVLLYHRLSYFVFKVY